MKRITTRRLVALSAIACLSLGAIAVATAYQLTNAIHIPTVIASLRAPQVTTEQIRQGELGDPLIFIDVRSPAEHAEDRIADSVLIPIADIEANSGLPQIAALAQANPEAMLVLYCQTGPRSFRAYQALEAAGLAAGRDYVVLQGGIRAWRRQVPTPAAALRVP